MQPIRMLIVDDHNLFRQGLRQICEMKGGFVIVGEAADGQAAVHAYQEIRPDVVLMDINMPVMNGIEAAQQIIQFDPQALIIVLTMYRKDQYVFDAIKAGARGYLLKNADADELVAAIRRVYFGEALIEPRLAIMVLDEFRRLSEAVPEKETLEQLTDGEMDVLRLVAEGADNQTISTRLMLSPQTVANRLRAIYQKLQVNNRTQAALVALRRGWANLDLDEPLA